jgi:hypothetical protein
MVARLSVFGRGEEARGAGSFTVARVSSVPGREVRVASSDPTGAPQAEQKRLGMGTSALQVRQRAMNFSGDSVTEGVVAGSSGLTRGLKFVLLAAGTGATGGVARADNVPADLPLQVGSSPGCNNLA